MFDVNFSTLEIIAFIFSLTGVILTIRQNILCWPAHLAGVSCYLIFYYQTAYFATMSLQLFYIIMSLYGWYYWLKGGKNNGYKVPVRKLRPIELAGTLLFVPVASVLIYLYLGNFPDSTSPELDSLTFSLSIAGTWMMAKKIIAHWIIWIIANVLYIYMFVTGGIYLTALLFVILAFLAIKGLITWRKSYELQNA
jgi:nicotinamide mononucleotide transporter